MRIDYNNVRAQAKKLLNVAAECESSAQVCGKYQNELALYWEGNAADAYIRGLQQLSRKNQNLAQQVKQLSQQITAVANDLEESDRRLAAQIAKRNAAQTAVAALPKSNATTWNNAAASASKKTSATTVAKQAVPKKNSSSLVDLTNKFVNALLGKR